MPDAPPPPPPPPEMVMTTMVPINQDHGTSIYSSCNGKVLLAAVVSLSVVVSFVLILHIYAKWFLHRRRPSVEHLFMDRPIRSRRSHRVDVVLPGYIETVFFSGGGGGGLDAAAIGSLPVFVYRSGEQKTSLVCVVCLSAVEEEDKCRVLPECKHVFHVECIDMWLASHSTCPICRAPVVVVVEEVPVVVVEGGEEVAVGGGDVGVEDSAVEVFVEMPPCLDLPAVKDGCGGGGGSSSSTPSSPPPSSSDTTNCSSSCSSSLGCTLKRILSSKSRSSHSSESKVFPSGNNMEEC